jgi:hypothetical protein
LWREMKCLLFDHLIQILLIKLLWCPWEKDASWKYFNSFSYEHRILFSLFNVRSKNIYWFIDTHFWNELPRSVD